MAIALADAPYIDLADTATNGEAGSPERRARIAALRQQTPLVRTDDGAMVITNAAVHAALGDKRLRSAIAELLTDQGAADDDSLVSGFANSVLGTEGERHIRLRRIVTKSLTPRAVEVHRTAIRQIANELIDAFDRDDCEFVSAFADQLPIRVISHILGVPQRDHAEFASWNAAITWALSDSLAEHRDEVEWGLGNLATYVQALIEDRNANPRDDLVTELLAAQRADPERTEDDVASMVMALLFAGHDTTRNQLGLGMWFFAHHDDQWQRLRDDPALLPSAVEEILRYHGAVGGTMRIAGEDLELVGYAIPAGTLVSLSLDAGNHDPAVYHDPGTFDVGATRESICSLGGGRHYCLGANLVRVELAEAFAALTTALPHVTVTGTPRWRSPMGIFGPEYLPLRFT